MVANTNGAERDFQSSQVERRAKGATQQKIRRVLTLIIREHVMFERSQS
jgi:hypothetical protein